MTRALVILAILSFQAGFIFADTVEPEAAPVTLAELFAAERQSAIGQEEGDSMVFAASGACEVTRYCDYPPPVLVTCSSAVGDCQIGSTWVQCDGVRQSCPACPPPSCSPICDQLDNVSCTPGKTTTCYYPGTCSCRAFTCQCGSGGTWICP